MVHLASWCSSSWMRRSRSTSLSPSVSGLLLLLATDYFSAYRFVRLCQAVEAVVGRNTFKSKDLPQLWE